VAPVAGVFELNRASPKGPIQKPPLVLSVQAVQRLEDGAPSYPSVQISVTFKGGKVTGETPFALAPPKGMEVTFEAPEEVEVNGVELKFTGWAIGQRSETLRKITQAKPPETTISASAQQVCVQSFTHGLQLSWDVSDGVPPVAVKARSPIPTNTLKTWSLSSSRAIRLFP
jgi:hypothetical protein